MKAKTEALEPRSPGAFFLFGDHENDQRHGYDPADDQ
jgi:hypothetical protein